MGQKLGKATLVKSAEPFANLPGEALEVLWEDFNLNAEGWALDSASFQQLVASLAANLEKESTALSEKGVHLFSQLDTDQNELVDGLECISALGVVSAVTLVEKAAFVFRCYDFSRSGALSREELALLLTSSATGLCKLCGAAPPSLAEIEAAVLLIAGEETVDASRVPLNQFVKYCTSNPIITSWLTHFDDVETGEAVEEVRAANSSSASPFNASDLEELQPIAVPPVPPAAVPPSSAVAGVTAAAPIAEEGIGVADAAETEDTRPQWLRAAEALAAVSTPLAVKDDESGEGEESDEPAGDTPKLSRPMPPDAQLKLQWVYGVGTKGIAAGAASYSAKGAAVYSAGRVGVVLSMPPAEEEEGSAAADEDSSREGAAVPRVQRHNQEHTDDIMCLAVSDDGTLVATGEAGVSPKIAVWNADTGATMAVLQGAHTSGITQLAWGPGSKLLASTGADTNHTLAVHAYPSGARLHAAPTGASRPTGLAYARDGTALAIAGGPDGLDFVLTSAATGAASAAVDADTYVCKRGTGLTAGSARGLHLCVSAWGLEPSAVVSGTAGGALCLWRGRSCVRTVAAAHGGAAVTCLRARRCKSGANGASAFAASGSAVCDAFALATGGQDGSVRLWSRELAQLAVFTVAQATLCSVTAPRSVTLSGDGRRVLVLTRGAELLELATTDGAAPAAAAEGDETEPATDATATAAAAQRPPAGRDVNGGPIAAGHSAAALAALAASPTTAEFATVGDDGVLRVWGPAVGLPPRTFPLHGAAHCAAYSVDGNVLAVGLACGTVSVLRLSGAEEPAAADDTAADAAAAAAAQDSGEEGTGDDTAAAVAAAGPVVPPLPALPAPYIAEIALPSGAVASTLRFSPNGSLLAVGCSDGAVLLYSTAAKQWALLHSAAASDTALAAPVSAIDFTANSAWLRVSSTATLTAAAIRSSTGAVASAGMTEMRGKSPVVWATHTCLSHGVQSAWTSDSSNGSSSGADVQVLSVSPAAGEDAAAAAPLLAVGGSSGELRLFRHPAAAAGAPALHYRAHCGPLSSIALTSSESAGAMCLTAGRYDKCVYQWALTVDDGNESGDESDDVTDADAAAAVDEDAEVDEEERAAAALAKAKKLADAAEDEDMIDGAALVLPVLTELALAEDLSEYYALAPAASTAADRRGSYAVKRPWIAAAPPSLGASVPQPPPEDDLLLTWVHGYAGQKGHQNVMYAADGAIVYPAASAAVVLTRQDDGSSQVTSPTATATAAVAPRVKQSYYLQHTHEVLCLAAHPSKEYTATGQSGTNPLVLVWSPATKATVAKLSMGLGKLGVSQLAFSHCGEYLAAACMDSTHTVQVYSWRTGVLKCYAQAGAAKVLAMAFSRDGKQLLVGGDRYFSLFDTTLGGIMAVRTGLFGSAAKVQRVLSAVALSAASGFVMGGSTGALLRIEDGGRKITSTIPDAHTGAIPAMYAYETREGICMITGGADGKVCMWDTELSPVRTFDLTERAALKSHHIRAVCLNDKADSRKILIGTRGSDVLEISTAGSSATADELPVKKANDNLILNGGACLTSGHSRGTLRAVAAHPARTVYATAGDDGMLREWSSAPTPRLIRYVDVTDAVAGVTSSTSTSQCCRYSPNGLLIAVGLTDPAAAVPSQVVIVSTMESELRIVHRLVGPAEATTGMRFSPDGNTLAAGGCTGDIVLYDVLENFAARARCPVAEAASTTAPAAVTAIDFSAGTGDYIRACSDGSSCAVRYLSAQTGAAVADDAAASAQGWATFTAVHGREVTGVWPMQAQLGTAVGALCRSNDRALVATAHASGAVMLHKFPCNTVGAGAKGSTAGGAGSAHNLVFTSDDNFLIAVGHQNRCIMQWQRVRAPFAPPGASEASEAATAMLDATIKAELAGTKLKSAGSHAATQQPSDSAARGGLGYAHGGALLYAAAADVIVHSAAKAKPTRALSAHSDTTSSSSSSIVACCVTPCGRYAAAADATGTVRVWDVQAERVAATLPRGLVDVARLAFDADGKSLAAVDTAADSGICVWTTATGSWTDALRASTGQAPRGPALFISFTATNISSAATIITGGAAFMRSWTLSPTVTSTVVTLPGRALLCGAPLSGPNCGLNLAVTGCVTGDLLLWRGAECVRVLPAAHSSAVYCVAVTAAAAATGGADGSIKVWSTGDLVAASNSAELMPLPSREGLLTGAVRAVAVAQDGRKVAASTAGGAVVELVLDSGAICCLIGSADKTSAGVGDMSSSYSHAVAAVGAAGA